MMMMMMMMMMTTPHASGGSYNKMREYSVGSMEMKPMIFRDLQNVTIL
jgi:hypothetical protein